MDYKITHILPKNTAICLASASPRRREILAAMGLSFTVHPCDVDESLPAGLHPQKGVVLLSERKARAARAACSAQDIIIASDTLVEIDGEPLGKPEHDEHALAMLLRLAGREHRVHTGVAVMRGDRLLSAVDTTRVFMRPFTEEEARTYIATGEPADKAGAYAIQGLGGALVAGTEGAFDTVVGLPSLLLDRLLCALTEEA